MGIRDVLAKNTAKEAIDDGGLELRFRELFRSATDEISDRWIAGTYEYLQTRHPDVNDRLNSAEDRLNHIWSQGRIGLATVMEFEQAVAEWSKIHREAIALRANGGQSHGDQ